MQQVVVTKGNKSTLNLLTMRDINTAALAFLSTDASNQGKVTFQCACTRSVYKVFDLGIL